MTLSIQKPGIKWLLYATALLFAMLSCADHSTVNKTDNDTQVVNSNSTTSPSDTLKNSIDNSGTNTGEGTTTGSTSTGSSSSHKDSVK